MPSNLLTLILIFVVGYFVGVKFPQFAAKVGL